jgi:D-glycero-D-manno-heptose 1,7-bisphosphate phosphatase
VFVDRDGTVVVDRGYLADPEGIELLPGAGTALQRLDRAGFALVLITNQSGVGRGFFSTADLDRQHRRLQRLLEPYGVTFARIEVCPHRPDAGCDCRKPAPGMILRAARDLGLDLGASFVIGDKDSDTEAGHRAGCTSVGIGRARSGADLRVTDLAAAADWILDQQPCREGNER